MLRLNRRRKANSIGHGTGLVIFDVLHSMARLSWTAIMPLQTRIANAAWLPCVV